MKKSNGVYSFSRFDLMAGFNGQEGGLFMSLVLFPMLQARNESIDDGCSMEMAKDFLTQYCIMTYTDQAAELCADYIIRLYGLDEAVDRRDRIIRLSLFTGRFYFCF